MNDVRSMTPEDLPEIGVLYQRVHGSAEADPPEALLRYLRGVLFEHPWRDLGLRSLVCEEDGRLAGCIGLLPRPLRFEGRPVRVAVAHSFMVDPAARRSLAGVNLLRAFLAGEQDLSFTDAANPTGRRLWKGLGGTELAFSCLNWLRILRPFRHAAGILGKKRPVPWPVGAALARLSVPVDALLARLPPNHFTDARGGLIAEEAGLEDLLASLERAASRFPVRPEYTGDSLRWLLEMAARKRLHGSLRARLVRDEAGAAAGHYLYYVRRGGVAQLLQLAVHARPAGPLLEQLFRDAWRDGAVAVAGRLEHEHVDALLEEYASIGAGSGVLAHARDPRLMDALLRGHAFLSRLEGEWWLSPLERVETRPASG